MVTFEDYELDYYSEESDEIFEILKPQKSLSSSSIISEKIDIPQFVSKYQNERAKYAAAVEEEKKEKLRKLLGFEKKLKPSDSTDTIITQESLISLIKSCSSESSENICLKNIIISDSDLKLLNIYNNYPIPDDPGLITSFWTLYPMKINYKDDGINKFNDLCKLMKLKKIKKINEMLQSDEINLSYYGIDPKIMKPLCEAIMKNSSIQILNLKENYLSVDACYHLNELLIKNQLLQSINLSGCKIGLRGAKRLINGISDTKSLKYLNLNKCNLGDEGGKYIIDAICDNQTILIIDLSNNKIFGNCVESIYDLLIQNEILEEINFSWNQLNSVKFWNIFHQGIIKNNSIKKINLSWNSLGKNCLPYLLPMIDKSINLKYFDISNNFFDNEAAIRISKVLSRNSYLEYLSLKNNPIGADGGLALIESLISENSNIYYLNLNNIWLNKKIIPILELIKIKKSNLIIKIGGILSNYILRGPDPKKIFLKRANFEAQQPKKKKQRKDFGQFILTLNDTIITKNDFQQLIKNYKLKLSESLINELMKAFEVNNYEIDQLALKKFYLQEYPDTQPPLPKLKKEKSSKKQKKIVNF